MLYQDEISRFYAQEGDDMEDDGEEKDASVAGDGEEEEEEEGI